MPTLAEQGFRNFDAPAWWAVIAPAKLPPALLQRLNAEINKVLQMPDVAARLDDAGIANASVNTIADVWAHPQLQARCRWTEIDTPAGPVPALLPPGCTDARMDAVPALGQHSEAVLAGLGFDAQQIDALRRDGVI